MTTLSTDPAPLVQRYADLGDVRLHYVECGEGPLVVLLHGFPEHWRSWRFQIPALAAAGFRVVAPDLRGYNMSDKPPGVRAYRLPVLARDVARLVEACGVARAALVAGHDWGGIVAWAAGMWYPERMERLAILNVPHPAALRPGAALVRQALRSWYIAAFQLPWLPEATMRARDFALPRRTFRHGPRRPGAFSEDDIDRYIDALAQPGALTATVNYYRALARGGHRLLGHGLRRIEAPTLVIWGEQDPFVESAFAVPDPAWVPHARVERLPQAGHWAHLDEPDRVCDLLIRWAAFGLRQV